MTRHVYESKILPSVYIGYEVPHMKYHPVTVRQTQTGDVRTVYVVEPWPEHLLLSPELAEKHLDYGTVWFSFENGSARYLKIGETDNGDWQCRLLGGSVQRTAPAAHPMKYEKGDDIPERVKTEFREDLRHAREWRKDAETEFAFVAGHQFSDDEINLLEEQGRPPTVFNRTGTVIDAVIGSQISNRQEVRYIPREEADVKVNEILTSAAKWFRDKADMDDEESDAFRDTIIAGMGWVETRLDFDDNPDGDLKGERLDPFEMVWDYNARKKNLIDARRIARVRDFPIEEARSMFPDFDDDQLHAGWAKSDKTNQAHQSDNVRDRAKETFGDSGELKNVTIVHLQWFEMETRWRVPQQHQPSPPPPQQGMMPPGMPPQGMASQPQQQPYGGQQESGPTELTQEEYEKLTKDHPELEPLFVKQKKKIRYQCFLGSVVLDCLPTACPTHFNFQCITGKRDQKTGQWYGLVRPMRDPQDWANKWLSQMLHIMNSNAKGGILAEHGAFEDDRQAEQSWAKADRITWMQPGSLSGPNPRWAPKPGPQFPAGHQYLTEMAVSTIRDVVGVNLEMLGMREADQPGVLEYQRRQAGMTILQPLFDSLKSFRRQQGELILYYIQNNLSDGRLVKIVGEKQAQYAPLVKQGTLEYDIIVDEMPTSPNHKEMVWQMLTQLLPMIKEMLTPQLLLKLLKYSPFPSDVVEDMEKAQQEQSQSPQAQLKEKANLLEYHEKEVDVQKVQAETQQIVVETQQAMSESPGQEMQIKQQESAGKLAIQQQKQQGDMALQREKQQGDMQLKVADMAVNQQLKARESAAGIQINQQQAASQAQLAKQKAAQRPTNGRS